MLKSLKINNYALIDVLNIGYADRFNIITGETGSGKSIILGALGLLKGSRADLKSLKDESKKCVVEGTFAIGNHDLKDWFDKNELDHESETIIRREITPSGKSRAFVNDTPVTLSVLKVLGERLIDIHSQHQTLLLGDLKFQTNLIDAFAGNEKELKAYKKQLKKFNLLDKELKELVATEQQSRKDLDYFSFQLKELEEADVKENELKGLEDEAKVLSNSEDIQLAMQYGSSAMDEEQYGVLNNLKGALARVQKVAEFSGQIKEVSDRIQSSLIELQDISGELEELGQQFDYDPERLNWVNERINTINRLLTKHQLETEQELIALQLDLAEKVDGISNLDERIANLELELVKQREQTQILADKITVSRTKGAVVLEKEVAVILKEMAMPHAKINMDLQASEQFTSTGKDVISLLFCANKGGSFKEIAKSASGGELSRVMLAIKYLLSERQSLPTIIFDEIDTGVSGDVASKMGQLMKGMSKNMQVMSITHLPQVAAQGNAHYKVYKREEGEMTTTYIDELNHEARIEELAKMLSGEEITAAALENAKMLMERV